MGTTVIEYIAVFIGAVAAIYGLVRTIIYTSLRELKVKHDDLETLMKEKCSTIEKNIRDKEETHHKDREEQNKKIEDLNKKLDNLQSKILDKLELIAEQNRSFRITYEKESGELKVLIAREYLTADTVNKKFDDITLQIRALPCRGGAVTPCPTK